jgi:UTP--glucose-1-phosphate uridylyltransferase
MKNSNQITKAVIALAGYGTRFLPATKNQPKQMLPIIDKPIVHYLVEEAVASGITDIILVTQAGQHIMEDYFDTNFEMESTLENSGKQALLEMVRNIPQMANFIYVRQKKHLPYGNGTPLLCVKDLIDNGESFVYMFGDDMTISYEDRSVTKQLMDCYYEQAPSAVLGVQEVPWEEVHKYASVKYKDNGAYKYDVEQLSEKLPKEQAHSNTAQFGRFVLSSSVINTAEETATGKNNELWLTDILNAHAQKGNRVIAQPINGKWLTTGDPLTFLQTTLQFALLRPDLKDDLVKYIKEDLKLL